VLLKQKVADVMAPGDHGSTFAGNPLVCHAACTVFDIIADPGGWLGLALQGAFACCTQLGSGLWAGQGPPHRGRGGQKSVLIARVLPCLTCPLPRTCPACLTLPCFALQTSWRM
jgi:acetylornithine aminotransferase